MPQAACVVVVSALWGLSTRLFQLEVFRGSQLSFTQLSKINHGTFLKILRGQQPLESSRAACSWFLEQAIREMNSPASVCPAALESPWLPQVCCRIPEPPRSASEPVCPGQPTSHSTLLFLAGCWQELVPASTSLPALPVPAPGVVCCRAGVSAAALRGRKDPWPFPRASLGV